ncbi:MAG: hypothetical protein ABJK59_10030 [Erythrobacter sp.]|uniref:hypothetical protein n=1 Tax=Erythrobacter sp. TaxID=1042 RepID=UPI0032995772
MDAPPPEVPHYEVKVLEGLQACGLQRDAVSVSYQESIQALEIVIGNGAGAKEAHFSCIHDAVGYETVQFEDGELWQAYRRYLEKVHHPARIASARKHLETEGLLEGLPTLEGEGSLELLLPALEVHCGLSAGSVLFRSGDTVMVVPKLISDENDFEKVACILAALQVSGVTNLGFIGNEKLSEGDE